DDDIQLWRLLKNRVTCAQINGASNWRDNVHAAAGPINIVTNLWRRQSLDINGSIENDKCTWNVHVRVAVSGSFSGALRLRPICRLSATRHGMLWLSARICQQRDR